MLDSSYSNKSDTGAEATRAYIRDLLALLGDRDPVAILEGTPPALEERVAAHDEVALRRPEAPGKWSVGQVIQHLADSEIVCGYRLRVTLAEDQPTIPGYDQDLWAERLGYADADPEAALGRFRVLRHINLPLWRGLAPEDFKRFGHHSERGVETIDQLLKLYAAHDLVHLRQIDRILATVLK